MAAQDDISSGIGQIASLVTQLTANPSPTVTINGETIDLTGYLAQLQAALPVLLQVQQALGGPYQRVTRMRT
jgi:hypothetical protein